MKTITLSPNAGGVCDLPVLGVRGENAVTQILFDFSSWAEEFGAGGVTLLVKRPGDTVAYPVVLTIDGTTAAWSVSATDTAQKGVLSAEYIFTVGEQIAKTSVFNFQVFPDIGNSGTPPDPFEDWLEQLGELGAQVQQDAADAAQAAEGAEGSAESAAADALKAEGYAVGEQNGAEVGSGSPYFENNAKFYAAAAQQAASEGGWVHFYIDEGGHLHYVKTPDVDLVFSIQNGYLHVTV